MTIIIAIWGATLSTVALGWNVYNWYCDRARLGVDAKIMRTVPDADGKDRLVVSAINLGRRPVNVKAWALKVKDGYRVIDTGKLPRKLQDGESFTDCLEEFDDIFSRPVKSLLFFDFNGRKWRLKPSRLRRLLSNVKKAS